MAGKDRSRVVRASSASQPDRKVPHAGDSLNRIELGDMKIQPIGVCRFSLMTTGGFKRGPASLDERRAFLFQESRLALRMAWFRHVVMPSIRAQSDQGFLFVVLASDLMPQKWQDELAETVADCPVVRLEFIAPGKHFQICNAPFSKYLHPDTDIVAQFRLDDDDAVAVNYIDRVRRDFETYLAPLYRQYGMVSGDYTSGFVLEADGTQANLHRVFASTWNCGQTVYLPAGSRQGLFGWGHHQLHCHMPTVTLHDGNMFLRGRHDTNDSAFRLPDHNSRPWELDALKRRFDIDLAALQDALRKLPS